MDVDVMPKMSAIEKLEATIAGQGFDPSTWIQKPTSAKTPDVSHVLSDVFGDLFMKEALSVNTIRNLDVSSDVDDNYHKRYVQILRDAQVVKESRLQEIASIEKHIMEARAKALAYEEREEDKRMKICDDPDSFGIPPAKAYFSYCVDETFLKKYDLLVPSDYKPRNKAPFVPIPKDHSEPTLLRETRSSMSRLNKHSILPPIGSARTPRTPHIDDIEFMHKSGSDDGSTHYDSEGYIEHVEKKTKRKTIKKPAEPSWMDALSQEERFYKNEMLKRLKDRVNFLPNPRLEAARTALVNKDKDNLEILFEVTPKAVIFDKYVIGKVYESSFEVRNIAKIAHQFRALPPKTAYFCLSLGMYPQGQSIIAPGLCATFNVRFAPDSLGTFEDEVQIECSNGSKLILPIIAKRESPCLSIGSVVNCGHALVGQIKVCRFIVQNDGGDGRFVIFPKSTWPAATFKTNMSSSSLNVYPFEIQPSIFELHKGSVFALEVVFKPPDVGKYEQEIVIACDNCTTKEFKIVGEGNLAELEYIELGEDQHQRSSEAISTPNPNQVAISDYKDKNSDRIIRFPTLNPNVFTRKRFQIKNKTACPIDYSWIIYKPILNDALVETEPSQPNKNWDYVVDKDTFFTIGPKQGTFDRNETKTFEVLFSPNKVGEFSNVAHLILHSIPEINRQLMINKENPDEFRKTYLIKDDIATSDFVSTVMEFRGDCEPFQFTLDPPALYIPGANYLRSTIRKAFRLINMSISPITFSWKSILEPHIIQVEPAYGEIAPKSYALMDVLITGVKPGKLIDDISCYVENADEPIKLHIEADIKGPEAKIKEAAVDFGLVQIGTVVESFVTLENISNLPLEWNMSVLEFQDCFDFPNRGSLKPLESCQLRIKFVPFDELIISTQFVLSVTEGNELNFNCFGQSQRPSASLQQSSMEIDELYLEVEKRVNIRINNHSVLPAYFAWGPPEGKDADEFDIAIDPAQSVIDQKSTFDCSLRLIPRKLLEITDLRIPCYVRDMSTPLFLNLSGRVKGVSVDFFISDPDKREESIHLLKEHKSITLDGVKVGEKFEKSFVIRNNSGIATRARLAVNLFKVYEISAFGDQENAKFKDPMKKINNFADRLRLKDKYQGIGFGFERYEVELPPFTNVVCPMFILTEMWGSYEDSLFVEIDGISERQVIPIVADIVDLPIKIYTGKVSQSESEEIAILRFGSQIQGSEPITRKLQLFNTCHVELQVDWRIYLKKKDDMQLVDLNVLSNEENGRDITNKDPRFAKSKEQIVSNRTTIPSQQINLDDSIDSSSSFAERRIRPVKDEILSESRTTFDFFDYFVEERVPLISLKLTSHYGDAVTDDNRVFYFNQDRVTLRPRDKTTISITFNTHVENCQAYEAVFVGYLTVPEKYLKGEGFERKMGFDKEPIRFMATGEIESPNLVVEYDNEDLSFLVATGDLIDRVKHSAQNEKIYQNNFSLYNSSLAPVGFNLKVNGPFCFANQTNTSQRVVLKSRSKERFSLMIRLDHQLLRSLDFSQSNPIVIDDNLVVEYTETLRQLIPIKAKIYAPIITTTVTYLDFDTCLVNQERCKQITLRNPSYSSVAWNLTIQNDTHSVFKASSYSGYIEASKLYVNKNEQTISVFFTAKHNEDYSAQLVLETFPPMSIDPIVIPLAGSGSYDQKTEAFLDI